MATSKWRGDAEAVAQVDTITFALTWATADTVAVTVGNTTLTLTVGTDTDTDEVALAVQEMMSGTTQTGTGDHTFSDTGDNRPEFNNDLVATVSGDVVTVTAAVAGRPFTMSVVDTTAGDGTGVEATATASAGPNHYDTAGNWTEGSVPGAGDEVTVENSNIPILYGLSNAGATLTSFTVEANNGSNFRIGLPETNADDEDDTYDEYRTTYLAIDCTTLNIGEGEGNGSQRIKIDSGTVETTLNVFKTSTARLETGIPCLLWKGTHEDNDVNVVRGDLGIAIFAGETAKFETMTVGWYDQPASDSNVLIESGITHKAAGTITQTGGTIETSSNVITVTVQGGTFTVSGAATATTITVNGGTCYYSSSGTLTTANVSDGGTFDFRRNNSSRTVTNCSRYEGGRIYDPLKTVTWTNGIDCVQCLFDDNIDCGPNRTWTPTAI